MAARSLADQAYDLCFEGVEARLAALYAVGEAGLGSGPDDHGDSLTERELQLVELGLMAGAAGALVCFADPIAHSQDHLENTDKVIEAMIPRRQKLWEAQRQAEEAKAS